MPLTNIVKPIFRGLGVAVVGFSATALLIQGLTEAWFGRYGRCGVELLIAVILFIVFRKSSRTFLVFLENRTNRK